MEIDCSKVVHISPKWTSTAFWIKLWNHQSNSHLKYFIEYQNPSIPGFYPYSTFTQKPFNSNVLIYIGFSPSRCEYFQTFFVIFSFVFKSCSNFHFPFQVSSLSYFNNVPRFYYFYMGIKPGLGRWKAV